MGQKALKVPRVPKGPSSPKPPSCSSCEMPVSTEEIKDCEKMGFANGKMERTAEPFLTQSLNSRFWSFPEAVSGEHGKKLKAVAGELHVVCLHYIPHKEIEKLIAERGADEVYSRFGWHATVGHGDNEKKLGDLVLNHKFENEWLIYELHFSTGREPDVKIAKFLCQTFPEDLANLIVHYASSEHLVLPLTRFSSFSEQGVVPTSTGWYYDSLHIGTLLAVEVDVWRSGCSMRVRRDGKAVSQLLSVLGLSFTCEPVIFALYLTWVCQRLCGWLLPAVWDKEDFCRAFLYRYILIQEDPKAKESVCLHPLCWLDMADGSRKRACDVRAGDQIRTSEGTPGSVVCTTTQPIAEGKIQMCQIGECFVTPLHPVRFPGGEWLLPTEVTEPRWVCVDRVCNFVLSAGCGVMCGGVECISLGHGLEGKKVRHEVWGGPVICRYLRQLPNYPNVTLPSSLSAEDILASAS